MSDTLLAAERDGLASMLLDVQRECVALRSALAAAEARVTALEAEKAEIITASQWLRLLAEGQAKFWRSHQRAAKDREEKTRFAVKAEPWENAVLALRQALAQPSTQENDNG